MAVDEKIVKRIAHLARMQLDDTDVAPMMHELNGILGWIEQLEEVETGTIPAMTSVVSQKLKWRADVVNQPELTGGARQAAVLANAADAQFGFFSVPKVIE